MSMMGDEVSERPYSVTSFQDKLMKFEEFISVVTQQDSETSFEDRRQYINDNLRYENFCEYIRALFGADIKTEDMKAIFRKISTNPDDKIDWSEVFGYFQTESTETAEEVGVFTVSKRKRIGEAAGDKKRRDTIQCVAYSPEYDCYVTASQKGALSIYNGKLRLQNCIDINESAWMTSCCYLPRLRKVIATTERSIVIWEHRAKTNNQSSVYVIKPLEHSPQCMCLAPSFSDHGDAVLIGDDAGYINLLRLTVNDFSGKTNKDPKRAAQSHILDPTTLTVQPIRRKFHPDWVLKVMYLPDINKIASCSPSDKLSFVIADYKRLFDNQPVSELPIPKGVNSFAYSEKLNVFATGGVDKVIRVWHPNILSRPTGKMAGHLFTIIAVVVNEKDQHIISLSTARVFRVWDLHTLTCLQVFTDNDEKSGDRRISCIMFDLRHDRLITGSSTLDMWPMTRTVQDTMSVPHTHDYPLTVIKFNKACQQIITVCSESIVKIWEVNTSRQMYQILEAHGLGIEVTCSAVNMTGLRMITGAYDGSIKAWEFSSGQEMKSSITESKGEDNTVYWMTYTYEEPDEDAMIKSLRTEETPEEALMSSQNECAMKRKLLALGWNNRLREYSDNDSSENIEFIREFEGMYEWPVVPPEQSEAGSIDGDLPKKPVEPEEPRKENIYYTHEMTCCAMMRENISEELATILVSGCKNGNVVLWNCEKGCVHTIFELDKVDNSTQFDNQRHRAKVNNPQRVNTVKILLHKVLRPDPVEVKRRKRLKRKKMKELEEADEDKDGKEDGVGEANDDPAEEVDIEIADDSETNSNEPSISLDFENEPIDMVEIKFTPAIVSCHQDASTRLWNLSGDLLSTLPPVTKVASPATSVCTDDFANYVFIGDAKGYLTMWDVSEVLECESIEAITSEMPKHIISWRAHSMKVVSMVYVDASDAVITASNDGSVRIWYAKRGHYIGYFGQHRMWSLSLSPSLPASPVLPYDITEGPQKPATAKSGRRKQPSTKQYDYPLVFDSSLWKPFRRSAYTRTANSQPLDATNKKFFNALVKPKADKASLESFKPAEASSGAIFRALPVYKLQTLPPPPTVPSIDQIVGGGAWKEDSSNGEKNKGKGNAGKAGKSRHVAKKTATPLQTTRRRK